MKRITYTYPQDGQILLVILQVNKSRPCPYFGVRYLYTTLVFEFAMYEAIYLTVIEILEDTNILHVSNSLLL